MAFKLETIRSTLDRVSLRATAVSGLLLALTACAGPPGWALRGQEAIDDGLVGVGHAHHVTNPVLRASVAENRARAALMNRLAHCTERIMLSYWRDRADNPHDGSPRDGGQQISAPDARGFTLQVIRRIRIVDQWEDGENSYRLARLDREVLRTAFSALPQLAPQERDYVAGIFDAEWPRCTRATTGLRGTFRKRKRPPKAEPRDDPAGCWTWNNRCA